ncbi:hypothetical protein BDZ89DRAFT_514406 [Hymenopellis radicata]|nr:hypothetical protein BDZ89DRAFT_514406 [Hymenopellis radicata]
MSTKLPPSTSDAIFSVSGSSIINAPVEKVWELLLGFDRYKSWNPFVRDQKVTDRAGTPTGHELAEGQYMSLSVHLPPSLSYSVPFYQRSSAFVCCTFLDNENHRVAWCTASPPKWLLHAERWQMLTVEADGRVKYESVEVFNGILAYLVRFFVGKNLRFGFDAMAEGLKVKAESA